MKINKQTMTIFKSMNESVRNAVTKKMTIIQHNPQLPKPIESPRAFTITPFENKSVKGADILAEQNKTMALRSSRVHHRGNTNPFHSLLGSPSNRNIEKAKELLFKETGLELHCPTTCGLVTNHNEFGRSGAFDFGLENLVDWHKRGLLKDFQEKGIKHVLIGHGQGSSIDGTWRFAETGESIPAYIKRTIPRGERCIVMCCETGSTVGAKRGISTIVDTTLQYSPQNPAKIVESGGDGIIGTFFAPQNGQSGLRFF